MGRRDARRPAQTIKKRRVEYEHHGEESYDASHLVSVIQSSHQSCRVAAQLEDHALDRVAAPVSSAR
jgi:hypothetical protein